MQLSAKGLFKKGVRFQHRIALFLRPIIYLEVLERYNRLQSSNFHLVVVFLIMNSIEIRKPMR